MFWRRPKSHNYSTNIFRIQDAARRLGIIAYAMHGRSGFNKTTTPI